MKDKVRVTQTRKVTIPRYRWLDERLVKTEEVHYVEEHETVLFSGSVEAFQIWRKGHLIPGNAEVKYRKSDIQINPRGRYEPQESFSQDCVFFGCLAGAPQLGMGGKKN